jgi:3-oxoacyl-[acyl-carrier protein] reductase
MTGSDRPLSGKCAVVTGGSRGIGRAVVERLARDGATVVFGYARRAEVAGDVERAVAEAGGHAYGVRADLAEPDAIATLFTGAARHLEGLDILVNNAAAGFAPTVLAEVSDVDYDRMMAINTRSVFLALRHAARHMRDGGRIVNLSSLNTALASPGAGVYSASKGAVEQLSAVAAKELGARGITVNAVSPGATDTDLLRQTNSPAALEMMVRMTPLGRLGQPADVADVIAFLIGPDGRWVTGQNVRVGGGMG